LIESLLLTTTRVSTFDNERPLTAASGFFFQRDERLFLVTSRHVVIDEPSKHFPNRIEIELHIDAQNLTRSTGLSVLLYKDGKSVWHQGRDAAGEIDVAVIELDRSAMPASLAIECFTAEHLQRTLDEVEVGSSLLVVGFPLGFHDTLHHLPVVRQAVIASSFGLRFQGHGYFLTDARTHRGTSGAPVVMRSADGTGRLPWKLLGVHSAGMDMGSRDLRLDESLGLNCAWYADILLTLTDANARIKVVEDRLEGEPGDDA
jgi:S1-C subfamily serine protease